MVGDSWHATFVRENGEKVESYFLYSGLRETDVVAIFYFEDKTDDKFKENFIYKSDLFVMDLVRDTTSESNLVILAERFGDQCVKSTWAEFEKYKIGGNCSAGNAAMKETDDGWAVYVKFFSKFPMLDDETKYELQWHPNAS